MSERKLINYLNIMTKFLNSACEGSQDLACGNCGGPLGSVLIEEIALDTKSSDDIPALLIGLQAIYTNDATRTELFCLLDEHITPARGLLTDSKSRSAACRRRVPTPSSPPDAASKTRVGPTSPIGGLVAAQPSDQKMKRTQLCAVACGFTSLN